MSGQNNLTASAQKRTSDATRRAEDAIRDLGKSGEPVTFAAVAKKARVSRVFLYSNDDLRAEIERARGLTTGSGPRVPAAERTTEKSLRARLRATMDDNTRLRAENQALRDELAIAHGRARELEMQQRARPAAVNA